MRCMGTRTRLRRSPKLTKNNQDATHLTRIPMRRMVTRKPWHENIGKRQVKAPKIFFRDSRLLHSLLHIPDYSGLTSHPRLGASWEGFALEQCLTHLGISEAYFWATHGGAELDLFFFKDGKRYGLEFKYTEAPRTSKSMHSALDDLKLEHLWVIHPGEHTYPAASNITMLPLKHIGEIDFG